MSNDRISISFAEIIDNLIQHQLQHETFSEMKLSSIEILRAKTCLAIYDLAYFIQGINTVYRTNQEIVKSVIDNTYKEFFNKYRKDHSNTEIKISDLVIIPEEQNEVLHLANTWGYSFDMNTIITPSILFPILFEHWGPLYLNKIEEGVEQAMKDLAAPFYGVACLFQNHFLKTPQTNFLANFYLDFNLRTWRSITQMIQESHIQRKPDESEMKAELIAAKGHYYGKNQDFEKALKYYDKAILKYPNCFRIYSCRAYAKFRLFDLEGAISDCNMAILLNPQYADAYVNRATAIAYKGNWNAALIDANKAIEVDPDYGRGYYVRRYIFKLLEEEEKADSDLNIAGKKGWDSNTILDYSIKY